MAMTEEQIIETVIDAMCAKLVIASLDELNNLELGRVYEALAKLRRPALE